MNNNTKYILTAVLILCFQVLVFNRLNLGSYISLMVYPLVVLLYPIRWSTLLLLILAFVCGVTVDVFQVSGGVHAAALLGLAVYRNRVVLPLFKQKDIDRITGDALLKLGLSNILILTVLAFTIQCFLVFLIEYWTLTRFPFVLLKATSSALVSFVVCLPIAWLYIPKR